jgi:hypothetical protein
MLRREIWQAVVSPFSQRTIGEKGGQRAEKKRQITSGIEVMVVFPTHRDKFSMLEIFRGTARQVVCPINIDKKGIESGIKRHPIEM